MMRAIVLGLIFCCSLSVCAQESIKPEDLARIKAATVFVKVGDTRSGITSSGSGFLVKAENESGWIITNHHVIDVSKFSDDSMPNNSRIEVIFESGTEKERRLKATAVAIDPVRDLAVLKISGAQDLPQPITIDEKIELRETMPVYICGFPFGDQLAIKSRNPEISIGDAKVSSLRREVAGGPIAKIQLNGALNPGNSGGPVVAPNGKLVGVAVTTVRNAGIGYAIPFHEVVAMLRGRLGNIALVTKSDVDDSMGDFPASLQIRVIDPFQKIKALTAHYQVGQIASPPTGTMTSAFPGSMKLPMTIRGDIASAELTVPASAKKRLTVQLEIDSSDGKSFTNALVVVAGPDRHEMPERVTPNSPNSPQRTPDGRLKLASGVVLPFPTIPAKFPTPKNSESVSLVNAAPEMFVGKTIRVDALSPCLVNPGDRGDFELAIETDSENTPTELRVVLPKDLALQIADLGIPEILPVIAQIKYPIRLTGSFSKPAGREKRHTLTVETIEFLDDDGKEVATFKPATMAPSGKTTLATVNRFPEKFVGQTLTVDAVVKGTLHAGGTRLDIGNENMAAPLNLECYTSRNLAGQVESDIAKADLPARVRLTFEVKAIHNRTSKGIIGIKQVDVLGESDQTNKSLKSSATIEYPAMPQPSKATVSKPAEAPSTNVDSSKPATDTAASGKTDSGEDRTMIYVVIALSFVLFAIGGFVFLKAIRAPKAPMETLNEPAKKATYTPRNAKPETSPKAKPAGKSTDTKSKPASDDNPFANFT